MNEFKQFALTIVTFLHLRSASKEIVESKQCLPGKASRKTTMFSGL